MAEAKKTTAKSAATSDDSQSADSMIPVHPVGPELTEEEKAKQKPLEPGDEGYDPFTDPVIPSSSLATEVARELAGSGKSPTRDALVEAAKSKEDKK